MTTMDQKAISLLGDMYQKIEVIAVENIYQDSVKYVETQVEIVGACVEKFYSELVQNLLPLLSGDPVEPETPGLHCADNGICDVSEIDVNREDVIVERENSSSDSCLAAELDENLDDTFSSGSCNKDESIEKSVPSQESLLKETPIESVETMSSPRSVTALLSEDGDCAAEEGKICNEMNESHEIDECIPSTSTISSSSGPTICDEFRNDEDMSKEPNGISNESVRDEIEINDAEEEVLQVSEQQQLGNMKLDESCVLVDKHQHISVSHLESKQSSYKIRDVLGLRRWSRSKNQEQLNTWLEDTDSSNERNGEIMASASTLASGNTNLQCNSLESGWEIV